MDVMRGKVITVYDILLRLLYGQRIVIKSSSEHMPLFSGTKDEFMKNNPVDLYGREVLYMDPGRDGLELYLASEDE